MTMVTCPSACLGAGGVLESRDEGEGEWASAPTGEVGTMSPPATLTITLTPLTPAAQVDAGVTEGGGVIEGGSVECEVRGVQHGWVHPMTMVTCPPACGGAGGVLETRGGGEGEWASTPTGEVGTMSPPATLTITLTPSAQGDAGVTEGGGVIEGGSVECEVQIGRAHV